MPYTPNHNYETPPTGTADWDDPLNANFEALETDVEIRDVSTNRGNYAPDTGAKFLATDTGEVSLGTGASWQSLGTITTPYTDGDAVTAVNNDADHGSTASHNYYTDSDAVAAINTDADHGSTASHDYFSGSHADLTNVSSGDHHAKTTPVDVSDSGTLVVSEPGDIDFAGNLSVGDDGDGTVTVDATDTNTHAAVSDSGTQVLADVDDINFASELGVTDDGDGTVTVDGSGNATTYKSNDIDSDGDGVVDDSVLWDGYEIYVQSSTPSTSNPYVRFEPI